jgi:hypothetical protein
MDQLLHCEGVTTHSQSLVASISTMMIESLRREGNDTTTQLLVARCANIELIIAATITDQSLR